MVFWDCRYIVLTILYSHTVHIEIVHSNSSLYINQNIMDRFIYNGADSMSGK